MLLAIVTYYMFFYLPFVHDHSIPEGRPLLRMLRARMLTAAVPACWMIIPSGNVSSVAQ